LALICQEIGLLKDENQNQKTEMALLKETMELKDRKVHHQIDQLAKELRQKMDNFHRESPTIDSNNQHLSSSEKARKSKGKRPARLLPLQLLYNRKSNGTDMMPRRFYGPPTNCSDLSKLGYTLNGFYQVKSNCSAVNDSSNADAVDTTNVETIYCAFKQPDGTFNSSNIETRSSKSIVSPINISRNRSGGGAHFHFMSHRGYFYPFPKNYTHTDFLEVKIPEKVLNLLEEGYFDESNSTFTAPKIGVYQFFFIGSMKCRWDDPSSRNNLRNINLNKNSQIVGYAVYNLPVIDRADPKKDIVVSGLIAATLQLNRGDQIYLKAYLGISKGCGLQDLTFIGSILQDMDH